VNDRQCSDITKKKNTTTLIKTWGRVPGEGGAGNASQRQLRSVFLFLSLSLSLSLCICLQQHTRLQSQPQLSLPFTYARTHALRESPATLARLLSFSLSLLSRVLSSRMRNNTNKKSSFRVPSESLCCFNTGVLLLLRYTASSTSKREREPDGFSSFVYLLRLLLASLWSSVCFRLPTLAVGFRSSCCRYFRLQS
jgi:hypothetical protein